MEDFNLTSESDRLALVERVFTYPPEPHSRKHGPLGYTDYESYRDWLRDEFSYRCVFSLMRESWPQTRFHIDHFVSQKERPDLVCDYDNLILLEGRLNLVKGKQRLPNPGKIPLGKCLHVHMDDARLGEIEAFEGNEVGEWIIRVLRLDSYDATEVRKLLIGILRSVARTDEQLFRKLIGYPANLPDLTKANPPDNKRKDGIYNSAHYRMSNGTLPEWY